MNNDKIDTRKEKYFAGTSSAEEEKWLKEHSGDPFFKTLKEEQEQEMDWEFSDFLAITGEQKVTVKSFRISFEKIGYWSAAAIFLIVFGTIFLTKNNQEKTLVAKREKITEQEKKKAISQEKEEMELNVSNEHTEQERSKDRSVKKVKSHPVQKQKPSFPEEITTYYPEYVVINGKPVYDLEEAKELTKNSLALLASNVEKSVSEMEHIKHLSVKF